MNALLIGDWQVLPSLNELRRAGASRRIQPQQMELLMRLAREPGEVIGRDILIGEVWSRGEVNDEVLSRAIAELRQALGDSARRPEYIETIPKRGYRLIARVGEAGLTSKPVVPAAMRWGLVLVGAAVLTAAALLSQLPDSEPVAPGDISTDAVVLTGQPGVERTPRLSADGQRVVYVAEQSVGTDGELAWVDVGSAAVTNVPLPNLVPVRAVWSPDGRRLAVSGLRDGRCLVLAQDETGQFQEVIGCGVPGHLDWAGDWLVFTPPGAARGAGLARLRLSDRTLEEVSVTQLPNQADSLPRVSPDGEHLAYARGDQTISEIWLQDLGGTHGPRQISHDGQLVTGLAWRDQRHLIYSSDRNGVQAIREINIDSGQIRALGARDGRGLDYAAGRLVWERPRYEANIWRIDLSGGEPPREWIVSNRYDNHPAVSPDGQRIVFISNRSDRIALWTTNRDGHDARRQLELPDARISRPSWHPDGDEVLFTAFDDEGSRLMVTDHDAQARPLAGTEGALEGVWMSDGRTLVMVRSVAGKVGMWRMVPGERAERIGTFSPSRVMADGEDNLWFTYLGAPGLFRLPANGLHPEAVVPTLPQSSWNDWTVRGDHLAYADAEGVWISDLSGANRKLVDTRMPNPVGLTMGLSANGQALFVAHTDGVEIDLVTATLE